MIVECSRCSTKFKIADEKVTDRGVKVRCSKCKHLFLVKKSGAVELDNAPAEAPKKADAAPAAGVPESVFKAVTKVADPSLPGVPASAGDVFSKPTRVAPPPAGSEFRPGSSNFPIPAPPPPPGKGKSLADEIDLDSDEQFEAPGQKPPPAAPSSLPPRPQAPVPPPQSAALQAPLPPPPAAARPEALESQPLPPPPAGARSALSDDLFGDLGSLEPDKSGAAPPVPSAMPAQPANLPAKPAPAVASPAQPAAPAASPAKPATPEISPPEPAPSAASPSLDDPFAGIEISDAPAPAPQAGAGSSQDPVSGEAVGRPTTDLFGDLGDPFAAAPEPKQPTPAAPPAASPQPGSASAPAPAASGPGSFDDPFASIDSAFDSAGVPPAAEQATAPPSASDVVPFASIDAGSDQSPGVFGGDLTDNDPFAQLDASPSEAGAEPSGLQLSEDGSLTGEDLPQAPPATKTLPADSPKTAPPPTTSQPAPPAPMATAQPTGRAPAARPASLWLYKAGFGVIGLLMALLLFVAYRSGGKPDLTSWSTYVRAFTGHSSSQAANKDLVVTRMSNTVYRNRDGHALVVVWGEVKNQTKQEKKALAVTAKLVNKHGQVAGRKTVPAGLSFTPEEVYQMLDGPDVDAAYRAKLVKTKGQAVAAGGEAAFMVVFFDHPDKMNGMEFRIDAEPSNDPMLGLPPEPEPETAEEAATDSNEKRGPAARAEKRLPAARVENPVAIEKKGTIVRLKPAPKKPAASN